jgi:hypothetical protein
LVHMFYGAAELLGSAVAIYGLVDLSISRKPGFSSVVFACLGVR